MKTMGTILNDVAATPYGVGYDPLTSFVANQVSEIRADIGETKRTIGEAESRTKEAVHAEGRAASMEFCNVNKTVSDYGNRAITETLTNRASTEAAKASIEVRLMENRYFLHDNILKAENNLGRLIDSETDIIKEKMSNFEARTAENFCDVKGLIKDNTRLVLERLTTDKLDEKNDEISRLRAKCDRRESELLFSNQNNKLESMINSIHQEQRFNSKTVQFGTGNLAGTAQTANQG